MKKGWVSIIGGIIIGLIISYFTLEYDGWQVTHYDKNGEVSQVINEIDVNLITNSFLIIVASAVAVYIALTLIGKASGKNQ